MSITTIKVDSEVRDRLSEVARKRGTTMGALLDELSRQAEEAAWWAEVYEGYERLRANKGEWADYLAELRSWTDAPGGGVWSDHAAAREEWPEYNS
jgi:predicted transcriptional regulator